MACHRALMSSTAPSTNRKPYVATNCVWLDWIRLNMTERRCVQLPSRSFDGPHHSKIFVWAHALMDRWDKSNGFRKHYICCVMLMRTTQLPYCCRPLKLPLTLNPFWLNRKQINKRSSFWVGDVSVNAVNLNPIWVNQHRELWKSLALKPRHWLISSHHMKPCEFLQLCSLTTLHLFLEGAKNNLIWINILTSRSNFKKSGAL